MLKVLPNGNVKLRLDAKKEGAGPSIQPPGPTPTATTGGYTTGAPSGGTISTGTFPTIGLSTTPGEKSTGIKALRGQKNGKMVLKKKRITSLSVLFVIIVTF